MIFKSYSRCLSLLLSFLMLFSLMPFSAFAAEGEETHVHDVSETEEVAVEAEQTDMGSESEPNLSAPKNPTVQEFQATIDDILVYYLGSADVSPEEAADLAAELGDEDCENAYWEILYLEDDLMWAREDGLLSEADMEWLYTANVAFAAFADAAAVRAEATLPPVSFFTTVTVLDGKVSIADTANSNKVSGGTVTITAKGSLFGKKTNNVTITNNSGSLAQISFSYAASSYNSFTIGGASASASGTYTNTLAAGGTVKFVIQSKSGLSDTTATLKLSDFSITTIQEKSNITFQYDNTLGSITVGGAATSPGTETVVTYASGTVLAASPNSGTTFFGWVDGSGKVLSTAASYTLKPAADMTVRAIFGSSSKPCFGVGVGEAKTQSHGLLGLANFTYYAVGSFAYLFDDLNAAATAAANSASKYIVLANSATLPAGTYTIPSGVTLLIPFDSANTVYTENAQWSETYTKPTEYRTLTMADGASLVINGALSISGKHHYTDSTSAGSCPTGPTGFIRMQGKSNITVNSGGKLYAYGYITGSGTVTGNSGATIQELLQIMDFRGGTQSTDGNMKDNKIFPMSQYYVQNVEVPMTINSGCVVHGYATIYASSTAIVSGFDMIGKSTGIFRISSGSMVKTYDGTSDRIKLESHGTASISSASLNVSFSEIDSADYILPLSGAYNLQIKSGSLTVSGQNVLVHPGVEITVGEGASFIAASGSSVYIADPNNWGNYSYVGGNGNSDGGAYSLRFCALPYAPGRINVRTDESLTTNTSINVLGSVRGAIYTSSNGANIHSTGNGTFIQTATANTSIYQCIQAAANAPTTEYPSLAFTPAKLKNGDETSIQSENDTYVYIKGFWHKGGGCSGTAATCIAPEICTVCGATVSPAKGHTEATDAAVAPTCTTAGKTEGKHCSVCGEVLVAQTEVAAKGHTEVTDAAVAPTCTTAGKTEGKHCSVCGTVTIAQTIVDALGHSYDDGVVTTAPTCTEAGVKTFTCSVCSGSYTEEIKATGHSYSVTSIVNATCTENGSKVSTCTNCGDEQTEVLEATGHKDTDTDHDCDYGCAEAIGTCEDADKDHDCDYGCDKVYGEHADADKDHTCDYGCVETIGTCEDADKDHACDYGCDKVHGTHEDTDKNHACDYGCKETIGTCEDADKDHDCDYGCSKYYGEHKDENFDHACDYGCSVAIGTCEDVDKDHACDHGCNKVYGEHVDENKDHACDHGCSKYYGEHKDENFDHACDYGCSVAIGTCEDVDKDHACDHGCDKVYGEHKDENKDHACDYGCKETIGTCADADKDHACDYGCDKYYGEHVDEDTDHACDYGCSVAIGTCEDKDLDHDCDYGCDKVHGTHEDTDKNHACDYGCSQKIGEHKDSENDEDHICDYCKNTDVLEECSDTDGDGNHACDVCGKEEITEHVGGNAATCTDPQNCTECGKELQAGLGHKDANKDHICDRACGTNVGEHADENKDHVCDYGCFVAIGTCQDADKDHACDHGCNKVFGEHVDADFDHACDYGCAETIGTCEDADKDHACDHGCNKVFGEHVDADFDHACDYGCAETIGTCEDADKDHDCDYGCDKYYGEHADTNKNHTCDYGCTVSIGDHVDADKDHDCDYGCSEEIGEHADKNKDHACDYGCSVAIGTCGDADKDHDCDYGCDKYYGEHKDENTDHACDYGCSVALGTCEDKDLDHACDYGCDKYYGEHVDEDTDHACDYGCAETIGTCEDADKDHVCDYGCNKVFGEHVDADFDHACDYGCSVAIGTCADADFDHACDYGCDKYYGEHADANTDHACDYGCRETIGTCEDADLDHDCDYGCDKVYGTCEDKDFDHDCDYGCDKVFGEHSDSAEDDNHVCDYGCGATLEACSGGEANCVKKAVCEICGLEYGELGEHNWTSLVYDWDAGYVKCYAERFCKINGQHSESAETTDISVDTDATCTTGGLITYIAHFEESWADGHSKTKNTDALGHDFGEDNRCTRCGELWVCEHSYIDGVCSKCGDKIIRLNGISLDAAAETLLNLYFTIPDEVLSTISRVVVSEESNDEAQNMDDVYSLERLKKLYSEKDNSYVLSRGIASGEMTGEVTVTFYDSSETPKAIMIQDYVDGDVRESVVRTAVDYSRRMLGSENANLRAICTAMVTYGGYAQEVFGVDAGNPAYEVLDEFSIQLPDVSQIGKDIINQELTHSEKDIGISYLNQSPVLDSVVSLKTYFTTAEAMTLDAVKERYSFTLNVTNDTYDINNALTLGEEEGKIVVRIEDIPPAYWDRYYEIIITDNTTLEQYTVTSSINAWIARSIEAYEGNAQFKDLLNLIKAMYLYNQAANVWFNR